MFAVLEGARHLNCQFLCCLLSLGQIFSLVVDLLCEQLVESSQVDMEAFHVALHLQFKEAFVFLRVVDLGHHSVYHLLDCVVELVAHLEQLHSQVDHGVKTALGSVQDLNLSVLLGALEESALLVLANLPKEFKDLIWGHLLLIDSLVAKLLENFALQACIRKHAHILLLVSILMVLDLLEESFHIGVRSVTRATAFVIGCRATR